MENIKTASDVIDAFGGNATASRVLGVGYNSICNWKAYGRFPADTYLLMQGELKTRGFVAPDNLWRMRKRGPVKKKKARA